MTERAKRDAEEEISEGAKMLIADPSILLKIEADQTATAEHKLGYFQAAAEAIDALNGRLHDALLANNRATTALHHTIQAQALDLITARSEAEEAHAQVQKLQEEVRHWNARITAEGPQFGPEDFAP